jgi:8-oxoguanine deaminase
VQAMTAPTWSNEARQALLLARVGRAMQAPQVRDGRTFFGCDLGPSEMTPRDALGLATHGGARTLGREDLGYLAVGMCADLALFDLDTLGFAGAAVHDPVGSLLLCDSPAANYTIVNGNVVVRQGHLETIDLGPLIERHNAFARQLTAHM